MAIMARWERQRHIEMKGKMHLQPCKVAHMLYTLDKGDRRQKRRIT